MGLPLRADPIQSFGLGQVEVFFGFSPNGSSTPTSQLGIGAGKFITSIARPGVGTFTLTFDAAFRPKDLIGLSAEYVHDNANPGLTDLKLGAFTFTPGTAGTLTVYTVRAGATVDVAANAASKVRGTIRFKWMSTADVSGL